MNSKYFNLLLVEDNRADADLFRILLTSIAPHLNLHFATDGMEASEFVHHQGRFRNSTVTPDLILLDLNVPQRDGRQLLREFKADPVLCKIPIVVISTSSSDREVADSYCLGASAFITKPVNVLAFKDALKTLVDFYFVRARLATKPGQG